MLGFWRCFLLNGRISALIYVFDLRKHNKGKVISPSAYWGNFSDNFHRIDPGIFQPFLEFQDKSTHWTHQKKLSQKLYPFRRKKKTKKKRPND